MASISLLSQNNNNIKKKRKKHDLAESSNEKVGKWRFPMKFLQLRFQVWESAYRPHVVRGEGGRGAQLWKILEDGKQEIAYKIHSMLWDCELLRLLVFLVDDRDGWLRESECVASHRRDCFFSSPRSQSRAAGYPIMCFRKCEKSPDRLDRAGSFYTRSFDTPSRARPVICGNVVYLGVSWRDVWKLLIFRHELEALAPRTTETLPRGPSMVNSKRNETPKVHRILKRNRKPFIRNSLNFILLSVVRILIVCRTVSLI